MSKILDTIKSFSPSGMVKEGLKNTLGIMADKGVEIFSKVQDGKISIAEGQQELEQFKLQMQADAEQAALEMDKAYLADKANARDMNLGIQRSKSASWLAKNTPYLLAITVVLQFLIMLYIIVFYVIPSENKEIFYTAFGALSATVTTIMMFFFGANKDTSDQNEVMREEREMRKQGKNN